MFFVVQIHTDAYKHKKRPGLNLTLSRFGQSGFAFAYRWSGKSRLRCKPSTGGFA